MAATGTMSVDSARGEQWCRAVDEITERVNQIMQNVVDALKELGDSDEGGTIGQKLLNAAESYLNKFKELVQSFLDAVSKVAEFLGQLAEFVTGLMDKFSSIGKLLDLVF